MHTFATRNAALTAMVLMDYLAQKQIVRNVHPQPNGDVLFRKLGAWFRLTPTSCYMLPEVVQVPVREQAQIALSGMNQMMADALDRYNPQHDAWNDDRRGRAYDDDRPAIEGYGHTYSTLDNDRLRREALARVQKNEQRVVMDQAPRRLVQTRLRYRQGQ